MLKLKRTRHDRGEVSPPIMHPDWQQQLPVAVYGTLRTGHHNAHLISHADTYRPVARLYDVALLGRGMSFPYAVRCDGLITVCELVTIKHRHWLDVISRIDQLEGFDSRYPHAYGHHYRRVRYTAWIGRQSQVVWLYLADYPPVGMERLIASGDWSNRHGN